MNPNLTTVAAWSYALAGLGYAAFAIYLRPGTRDGLRGLALFVAVSLTAAWALFDLAFAVTQIPALLVSGSVADVLRMGAWYAFLLLLIERRHARAIAGDPQPAAWLVPVAAALCLADWAVNCT